VRRWPSDAEPTWQRSTVETIARNEALMAGFHILGTPGLVYWDDHKKPRVFAGMPDPEQLRKIVGKR
jgi:protein-disulfide isomerase